MTGGVDVINAAFDTAEDGCPIRPLGFGHGTYYYLSRGGELRVLRWREHVLAGISSLFGGSLDWLADRFPPGRKETPFDVAAAQAWLFRSCERVGRFDPRRIRGVGVWPDEGGGLIMHCGDGVLVGGDWLSAGRQIGQHVYPTDYAIPHPAAQPCDSDWVRELYSLLCTWDWTRPSRDPLLLLGWLGCAVLVGVLRYRPAIWVTGSSGGGKTTIEALFRRLLGETYVIAVSQPTESAVRQSLSGSARPVLIDEIEPDHLGTRASQVAELVRVASSADQAPIARGSASGQAMEFPVRAILYFTSILVPPLDVQDRNRLAVLELREQIPDVDTQAAWQAGIDRLAGQAASFRARVLARWPVVAQNRAVVGRTLAAVGYRHRSIDQLGTLLSVAAALLFDQPLWPEKAEEWVSLCPPDESVGADEENNEARRCLIRLQAAPGDRVVEGGQWTRPTLAEMVAMAVHQRGEYLARLRTYGLSVQEVQGELMVCVANQHQALEQVFAGSKWAGGVWRQALRRLREARPSDGPISFASAKIRATLIPIDHFDVGKPKPQTTSGSQWSEPW